MSTDDDNHDLTNWLGVLELHGVRVTWLSTDQTNEQTTQWFSCCQAICSHMIQWLAVWLYSANKLPPPHTVCFLINPVHWAELCYPISPMSYLLSPVCYLLSPVCYLQTLADWVLFNHETRGILFHGFNVFAWHCSDGTVWGYDRLGVLRHCW